MSWHNVLYIYQGEDAIMTTFTTLTKPLATSLPALVMKLIPQLASWSSQTFSIPF
jgi:hypothetical protein